MVSKSATNRSANSGSPVHRMRCSVCRRVASVDMFAVPVSTVPDSG